MCAIPERLRGAFTTRRYTNPRLPYLYLYCEVASPQNPGIWWRQNDIGSNQTRSLGSKSGVKVQFPLWGNCAAVAFCSRP